MSAQAKQNLKSPPESKLALSPEKKADVLISLVSALRSDHLTWIGVSHKVSLWSMGLLVAPATYLGVRNEQLSLYASLYVGAALLCFGLATQLLLHATRRAHSGIGNTIVRCEAALRMYERDSYLVDEFFQFRGKWVSPHHVTALQLLHGCVLVLSICFVLITS